MKTAAAFLAVVAIATLSARMVSAQQIEWSQPIMSVPEGPKLDWTQPILSPSLMVSTAAIGPSKSVQMRPIFKFDQPNCKPCRDADADIADSQSKKNSPLAGMLFLKGAKPQVQPKAYPHFEFPDISGSTRYVEGWYGAAHFAETIRMSDVAAQLKMRAVAGPGE